MKRKKIIIVYSGAKHPGGIESYLENLFRFYDKKKMQLILISLGDWQLVEQIKKAKGKAIVLSGRRITPGNILKIKQIAEKEGASLIVSQGVVANAYARSAAALAKLPHLATVHSDFDLDYSNPLIRSLYEMSDKAVRWKTDKYIVVSKYLKKKLASSGIDANKIEVIYNGVQMVREQKVEKGGEIIIGSMGRLHSTKGYDNLIEAFSMINTTGLKLIIWGEGKERKNLEGLVKKLNMEKKVEMPGYVENTEALAKTDIYIQPSLSEGFGLGVVEAMLVGKPVIVTPKGSLKEIVDKETGIISAGISPKSLAKTMELALSNPEMLAKISENAKISATQNFSVEKWIEETQKVYLETVK